MQGCRLPHRDIVRRPGLWLAPAAVLLAAGAAHAQTSPACEQFKGVLAKRISGSFTLEDVPADEPVPPGAKVVATCEAGARKILLIRPGRDGAPAAQAPTNAASAAPTPPEPSVAAPPPAPRTRPADVRVAAPTPPPERPQPPAPVVPAVETPRAVENTPAPTLSPARDATVPAETLSLRDRATAWLGPRWHWLLAPLLLVLGAGLWAWWSHRSAYDEAGLPRGPRLN